MENVAQIRLPTLIVYTMESASTFIHFQETSPKRGCLTFVTYDSSLPLQCLHLVPYSYSVVNLYKLLM